MRRLHAVLSALLPILLCVALLGTIYLTMFEWEWVAFLSGVFVAAVLSLSSRATHAEWRVVRKTRQLEKLKARFVRQAEVHDRLRETMADTEERLGLLIKSIREPVLYVDHERVCRHHNKALALALGVGAILIDGRPLRDVMDQRMHPDLDLAIDQCLRGETVFLRRVPRGAGAQRERFDARLIPQSRLGAPCRGLFVLMTPLPEHQVVPRQEEQETWEPLRPLEVEATDTPSAAGASVGAADVPADPIDAEMYQRFVEALEEDRFQLIQQPIRALAPGHAQPRYHEILIRMRDEERNLLPPGAFFVVAEHFGLMCRLDRWVIEHLLDWCRERKLGMPHAPALRFCVNLSAQSLLDPAFPSFVRERLAAFGMSSDVLCFEIAEADLLAHRQAALACAGALQSLGCHIALDGFGTAPNAFDALEDFPVDFIKIDGSIVGGIGSDANGLAHVKAITRFAHASGACVVAECVENATILERLQRLGVDFAQGFAIAMPQSMDTLLATGRKPVVREGSTAS